MRRPIYAILTTLAGWVPSAVAHDPGYFVIDLGTLGGAASVAWDVNENGEVVGAAQNESGEWRAFRWRNGRMTDLGALGGAWSRAFGLNTTGDVVGEADLAGDGVAPFGWRGGRMIDLGDLGGAGGHARDLNDECVVVGASTTGDGNRVAFRWERGVMAPLGLLPGYTQSQATGINQAGLIVGWSASNDGVNVATAWESRGIRELGTLGGPSSQAFAVNRDGHIVGVSDTLDSEPHAFLWAEGVMTDLGSFPIGGESRAYDVNVIDEVVGEALLPSINEYQAILWQNGVLKNINTLLPPGSGWETILSAHAITNSGKIVGVGRLLNGETHAVLLDPRLGLANPIPGEAGQVNLFDAAGATPFSTVHIVYGFSYALTSVPMCPGVTLEIERPRLLTTLVADETGHAITEIFVPELARGRMVLFQAIEEESCEKSIVLVWNF